MSWIFLVCHVVYLFGPVASGNTGLQCGLTKCQDGHICILKMDSSKLNIHCSSHTNQPQTIPCLQSSPTNIQHHHIDCYCTSKLCVEQTLQLLRGIHTMLSTPKPHKEPNPKHDDMVQMTRTLSPSTTTAVTTTTTARPTTVKNKQISTSTPRTTTPCQHHKPITPPFHTLTRKPLVVKHCNKIDLLNAYGDTVRVTHPDARRCPLNGFAKSDAVVMKYCSARQVSAWIQDIQVSGNCQYLPTYIPIAQFHRGVVTDKTGIFVSCQQGNEFVMLSQSCDKGLHLVNVTWPETESFNVVTWSASPISMNVSSTTHTTKPMTTSATTHTMLPTTTSATTHTMLPMTTSATTQNNSTSTISINTKKQVMTTTMSTGGCTDLVGVNCTVLQKNINVCSMPIADHYCPRSCGLCQHSTLHVNPVQIFGRK